MKREDLMEIRTEAEAPQVFYLEEMLCLLSSVESRVPREIGAIIFLLMCLLRS